MAERKRLDPLAKYIFTKAAAPYIGGGVTVFFAPDRLKKYYMKEEKRIPEGQRILFVCSYNEMRSSTAETIFTSERRHVRSAGTDERAKVPLDEELVRWADLIFVMEEKHKTIIETVFKEASERKQIVVLGIPDNYYYMEPALVVLLKERTGPYLR